MVFVERTTGNAGSQSTFFNFLFCIPQLKKEKLDNAENPSTFLNIINHSCICHRQIITFVLCTVQIQKKTHGHG